MRITRAGSFGVRNSMPLSPRFPHHLGVQRKRIVAGGGEKRGKDELRYARFGCERYQRTQIVHVAWHHDRGDRQAYAQIVMACCRTKPLGDACEGTRLTPDGIMPLSNAVEADEQLHRLEPAKLIDKFNEIVAVGDHRGRHRATAAEKRSGTRPAMALQRLVAHDGGTTQQPAPLDSRLENLQMFRSYVRLFAPLVTFADDTKRAGKVTTSLQYGGDKYSLRKMTVGFEKSRNRGVAHLVPAPA
jgi:hypothetical protein